MEWRGEESENAGHLLGKRLGLGGSLSLVPRGSGVTCWGWEGGERLESGRRETGGGRGRQGRGTEVVRKTGKKTKHQERAETGRGRDEGDQEKERERIKRDRQVERNIQKERDREKKSRKTKRTKKGREKEEIQFVKMGPEERQPGQEPGDERAGPSLLSPSGQNRTLGRGGSGGQEEGCLGPRLAPCSSQPSWGLLHSPRAWGGGNRASGVATQALSSLHAEGFGSCR